MDELLKLIADAIARANDLNQAQKPTRNRQLSLAITRLEEAAHWGEAARREAAATSDQAVAR
jgi:hypothetical protein